MRITFQYIIANSFNFFVSLKTALITLIAIFMMSAKLTTLGLFKTKVF